MAQPGAWGCLYLGSQCAVFSSLKEEQLQQGQAEAQNQMPLGLLIVLGDVMSCAYGPSRWVPMGGQRGPVYLLDSGTPWLERCWAEPPALESRDPPSPQVLLGWMVPEKRPEVTRKGCAQHPDQALSQTLQPSRPQPGSGARRPWAVERPCLHKLAAPVMALMGSSSLRGSGWRRPDLPLRGPGHYRGGASRWTKACAAQGFPGKLKGIRRHARSSCWGICYF